MIGLWILAFVLFLPVLVWIAVDQAIRLMARRQRRESVRTLDRLIRQGDLPEVVPPSETVTILSRDGYQLSGQLLSEGPVRRLVVFTHGVNASGASGLPFGRCFVSWAMPCCWSMDAATAAAKAAIPPTAIMSAMIWPAG